MVKSLRLQLAHAEEKLTSSQERVGGLSIQLEQLQVLERCHAEAAVKADEEILSLKAIVVELQNDIAARDSKLQEIQDEMRAKEGAYEES